MYCGRHNTMEFPCPYCKKDLELAPHSKHSEAGAIEAAVYGCGMVRKACAGATGGTKSARSPTGTCEDGGAGEVGRLTRFKP